MNGIRRSSNWRSQARERIEKVSRLYSEANPGSINIPKLRKAINAAYPFKKKTNYLREVWREEVEKQLDRCDRIDTSKSFQPKTYSPLKGKPKPSPPPPPGQLSLFNVEDINNGN